MPGGDRDDEWMSSSAPGWFPDQAEPEFEVFWNGSRWTGDRRRVAVTPNMSPDFPRQDENKGNAHLQSSSALVAGRQSDTGPLTSASSVSSFIRTVRGRWITAGLVAVVLAALIIPTVINGVETSHREQAAAREIEVRAARLAVEARDDALVDRQETLDDARAFLMGDLGYAPEATVTALKEAVGELEKMPLSDAATIRTAVQSVRNGKTNVGVPKVPYTWSLSCLDFASRSHEFVNFREAWKSTISFSGCREDERKGDFFSDEQKSAVASGAVSGVDELGVLDSICGALGSSSYGSMTAYSESQAKELYGALSICPDHPKAGEIRAKVDSSLAEAAALADGTAFGSGVKRVGQEVQPGTYATEGALNGCYWERTDGAGEIIDNNFIGSALRAEVTIRASDYSFSSNRCGTWKRQ